MTTIAEAVVEEAALGWQVARGPDIAPEAYGAGRIPPLPTPQPHSVDGRIGPA